MNERKNEEKKKVKEERKFHFSMVTILRTEASLVALGYSPTSCYSQFRSSKHMILPQEWSLSAPAERDL
jgi:hypothetical protein